MFGFGKSITNSLVCRCTLVPLLPNNSVLIRKPKLSFGEREHTVTELAAKNLCPSKVVSSPDSVLKRGSLLHLSLNDRHSNTMEYGS